MLRLFDHANLCSAVLFVDLTNAFHRLIREVVTGPDDHHQDFHNVLAHLASDKQPFDVDSIRNRTLDLLTALGCHESLVRLLRDVHTDTWFTLSGHELIRTRRGTRPGSPLADIVFHVIMTSIMADVEAWIFQQSAFRHHMDCLGLSPITIIWSDDVAIPWAANSPHQLVQEISQLTAQVEHQFARRGFELNFGPVLGGWLLVTALASKLQVGYNLLISRF